MPDPARLTDSDLLQMKCNELLDCAARLAAAENVVEAARPFKSGGDGLSRRLYRALAAYDAQLDPEIREGQP